MIEFDNVNKIYPDGTVAAADVSFTVPRGSTTVLVGSSGSGKSTLLGMINRMVDPSSGRVFIDGTDVAEAHPVELRRTIGYIMQAGGLLPHKTVLANISLVAKLKGMSTTQAQEKAYETMKLVGLSTRLAKRYPAQLSGGQQQRVGVARALATDSEILLMDEPFSAVDPIVRRDLQAETRRLQAELGKTIVFVTHDIDEAFAVANDIIVLRPGGAIAQRGTPMQLLSAPADDFVAEFIGITSGAREFSLRTEGETTFLVDSSGRVVGELKQ